MIIEEHEIKVHVWKDNTKGVWVVRVSGITSGFEVHGGDGDNMAIECRLDADRFKPVIVRK
jgi:hypothetical protein